MGVFYGWLGWFMGWVDAGGWRKFHRRDVNRGKALLALEFNQTKEFPSVYGVFGRKSSVFWQNGTYSWVMATI
jgi:hypothetical protein